MIDEKNLLNFWSEQFNIEPDDALEEIEHMKNEKILENHINNFSAIWQGTGEDTRWKTYLPADNKRGKKLIASTRKLDIENKILAYYKKHSKKALRFHTLYLEWLNMKRLEVSGATIERIHSAYLRFYQNQPIDKKSIMDINFLYLKEFLLSNIKQYDMNYKQYCNFACVLRGVIQYAIDKELIEVNPFDKFHLNKKTLRAPDNRSSKKEVFLIDERIMIEKAIWNDFKANPVSTVQLAVLLDFYTGLRSGELVTITWSDIEDHLLHVHRTESSYTVINRDGTKGNVVYEVKEAPKSDAGIREVELIPKALEVLEVIRDFNQTNGWNSDYIFLDDGNRIIRKRLDTMIRKYCKELNITTRSMHKIRKYYISALKVSNVEDDEIRRLAGHKDLTTTFNSYCFSVLSDDETRNRINSAL